MIKIVKSSLVALSLIGFTGCISTSDIEVNSEKSQKIDLKGYKTYQFVEGSGVAKDTTKETVMQDLKVSTKIEAIINENLTKKGKSIVSKNPDFLVAYLGGVDRKAIKSKLDKNGKETIEKSPEAALVLMFVDADNGKVIWMSSAEGKFKGLSLKDRRKRIRYAVNKMLSEI